MSDAAKPDAAGRHEPDEISAVRERYARRNIGDGSGGGGNGGGDARYRLTHAAALLAAQERQRAIRKALVHAGLDDLGPVSLLEVGSGGGGNLLEMLWLGFAPEHLVGVELLPERHSAARKRLPSAVRLMSGDAAAAPWREERFDIVYASTVFSSLLDDAFQTRLAAVMWDAVKPGGAVLWYDFTVDNPRNADVRGVPLRRLRALFPQGRIRSQRITLAPPLARMVTRGHPALYGMCNAIPILRTHLLAWIGRAS